MKNPDLEAIEHLLETLPERVSRNVQVVTPESLGQDYLLHISTDVGIRKFEPFISTRAANTENRNIARVCTAPTILGCYLGYGDDEFDFMNMTTQPGAVQYRDYKGGYKIYALPFKAALKPNARLVYDSKNSDEHWLVSYNDSTKAFVPEAAGKLFVSSVEYTARQDQTPEGTATIYLEITRELGLHFSKRHFLAKGFWKITGPVGRNTFAWTDDKRHTVESVSKSEYQSKKNLSAVLLGFEDKAPSFSSW